MPALPDWRFGKPREADFEPLLALRIEVMREHLERVGRFTPERSRRVFRGHFDEPGLRLILVGAETAGCVGFRVGPEFVTLDSFYLATRFQNAGLGSAIFKTLLAEADTLKKPMRLEVLKLSPADRFYLRHGFSPIGEGEHDVMFERLPGQSHASLQALLPREGGHQFVVYGDSCSGIAGAPHERTFAGINATLQRLSPPPEFVVFLGDEIAGLTANPDELRAQWRHWHEREMGWLDTRTIPLWQTTSNHTTYDRMSEAVFSEMHVHLPRNGPPGQEGLSYWVRRGDLLLVCVHTLWTGLGGEGHVETQWLNRVLRQNADARYKLVAGHHPAHTVNGFAGAYQRDIAPEHASAFWDTLVDNGVLAYLCSHILAFDAQVHRGVLQLCTAGAGTAHRMPDGIEYLHGVQAALDSDGLRYQVFDSDGRIRERLSWPVALPAVDRWKILPTGEGEAAVTGAASSNRIVALRFTGRTAGNIAEAQTLLAAFSPGTTAPLWIGLQGPEQKLTVVIGPEPRRSPHYWIGPSLASEATFDLRLLIHTGMGPGGILCSIGENGPWSSLVAASAWGAERLAWPGRWNVGHGAEGTDDRPFRGTSLVASVTLRTA
ncbi:MAG TPA: GNAT family N-acetyltransferase [Reyranella sp.]|nr:GNAT family N-acetyltransferase [Reyranella sp.]